MKKKIIFIRHAQSKMNAGLINHPSEVINCRITELGKTQATKLDFSFDLLILSPLKRAIETYTYSNIKVNDVIISDLFQELKHGEANMLDNVDHSKIENMSELNERSLNAYNFLMSLPHKNIGIISHHDFLNFFLKKHFNLDVSLNNCSAYFLEEL